MKFADHLGEDIWLIRQGEKDPVLVKLIDAEPAGIWVENQKLTNHLLTLAGLPALPKTPLVFLPFSEIAAAIIFAGGTSLNEASFGVKP